MSSSYAEHIIAGSSDGPGFLDDLSEHAGVPTTHNHLVDFFQNTFGVVEDEVEAWLHDKSGNTFLKNLEAKLKRNEGTGEVTVDEPPGSWKTETVTVNASGAGFVTRGSDDTRVLILKALPSNTGTVFLRPDTDNVGGYPLVAGETVSFPTNANVFGRGSVDGQQVCWLKVNKRA